VSHSGHNLVVAHDLQFSLETTVSLQEHAGRGQLPGNGNSHFVQVFDTPGTIGYQQRTAPPAQGPAAAQQAVMFLDLGVNGYTDLGHIQFPGASHFIQLLNINQPGLKNIGMKINEFLEQRGKDIGVVGAGRNSQLERLGHLFVLR
jgi:hypothetical protein